MAHLNKNAYRIALYAPAPRRHLDTLIKNFEHYLTIEHNISSSISRYYNSTFDQLSHDLQVHEPDLFIALTPEATKRSRELMIAERLNVPFLFSGVEEAAGYSHIFNDSPLSGIISSFDNYVKKMSLIFQFSQTITRVALMYDKSSPFLFNLTRHLQKKLQSLGIQVVCSPLPQNITRRHIMLLAQQDMLILLADELNPLYIQRLSRICRQHQTLLYSSDLNATRYGAALSFNINQKKAGKDLAAKAYQFFTTGEFGPMLGEIDFSFKVNLEELERQGLALIKVAPLLSLINETSLVEPTTQEKIAAHLRLEQIPLE